MRTIILLCLFLSVVITNLAYAQDKYNNFSPYAIEPENFFEYPYNDSRPEPYTATIRRTPYDAGAALEGQVPDNDVFKRRSYTGRAEFLRLQAPEPPKAPQELTAIEKKALLEELIYARYDNKAQLSYNVMELLPEYYCSTADSRLMGTFLDMLWANRQVAGVQDWLALSECFICRPENMLKSMDAYSKESKRLYRSQIIYGIELLLASATRQQELKRALDRLEN